jgi:CubicO group peptidase (beta-lactamase class C family)
VAQFMRADFGDVGVAEMTRIVAAEPLAFEPGTRQMYSNGGYVVLGRVIEVLSGRPYDGHIAEHVYRPAGMTASGFVQSADRSDAIALPASQAFSHSGNPAGGGYSTAEDLFRFAEALRSGRLLGPTMTRYVLDGTFAEGPRWGFSLREQIVGAHRFIGNGGGAPGVNAEFRFEPAGAHIVVVRSNSSPPSATNLLGAILNRIAGVASGAAVRSATGAQVEVSPTALRAEVEALHRDMMAAFRADAASVATFY